MNQKEPEKRTLKAILEHYELWQTFLLFLVGFVFTLIGRILIAVGDTADGLYLQVISGLCYLGAIAIAGPIRKEWDTNYKRKHK